MEDIEFVKRGRPEKYSFDLGCFVHLGDSKHYETMTEKEAHGLRSLARAHGIKLSVKRVVGGGYFATKIGVYE